MAGRKSKGDRHAFMTRIPRDAADRLIAEAESLGVSYSDMIAYHVAGALGVAMALPSTATDSNQGELNLPTAS